MKKIVIIASLAIAGPMIHAMKAEETVETLFPKLASLSVPAAQMKDDASQDILTMTPSPSDSRPGIEISKYEFPGENLSFIMRKTEKGVPRREITPQTEPTFRCSPSFKVTLHKYDYITFHFDPDTNKLVRIDGSVLMHGSKRLYFDFKHPHDVIDPEFEKPILEAAEIIKEKTYKLLME